jgi:hypothetical protein
MIDELLKRAQTSILATIQTSVPRKQWAQWEVTLRFCLNEIFLRARLTSSKAFEDNGGLRELILTIAEGRENDLDRESFDGKIDEMLGEMKTKNIAGFDPSDTTHGDTLRAIRSVYASEWATYLVRKVASSE